MLTVLVLRASKLSRPLSRRQGNQVVLKLFGRTGGHGDEIRRMNLSKLHHRAASHQASHICPRPSLARVGHLAGFMGVRPLHTTPLLVAFTSSTPACLLGARALWYSLGRHDLMPGKATRSKLSHKSGNRVC